MSKEKYLETVPTLPINKDLELRFLKSKQLFKQLFNKAPDFYVRVPGRVNLIGEHIDYCGYGVCPMAIKQDIVLAVGSSPNEKKLMLCNVDPKYSKFECDLNCFKFEVNGSPTWYQYFLCGLKGILEVLPSDTTLRGAQVLVDGSIPQSAGLSSSSALVSAAALAMSRIYDLNITKTDLSNLCASCERYIGTQGGGMDQAIAFLASKGCAKYVEFCPLRTRDVSLPNDGVFVICHSLVEINKAATSDFNCRVAECRLASQLLAKKMGLKWQEIKTLGALQKHLNCDLSEMVKMVSENLHEKPYSKDEILKELDATSEDLMQYSLPKNTSFLDLFKLRQRAEHVYKESLRVEKFYEICNDPGEVSKLEKLGKLMTESHESLKNLYECSHPQLDKIVELAKSECYGARLTGAGWGGCVVALISSSKIEDFVTLLKKKFYQQIRPNVDDNMDHIMFTTSPQMGASIHFDNE